MRSGMSRAAQRSLVAECCCTDEVGSPVRQHAVQTVCMRMTGRGDVQEPGHPQHQGRRRCRRGLLRAVPRHVAAACRKPGRTTVAGSLLALAFVHSIVTERMPKELCVVTGALGQRCVTALDLGEPAVCVFQCVQCHDPVPYYAETWKLFRPGTQAGNTSHFRGFKLDAHWILSPTPHTKLHASTVDGRAQRSARNPVRMQDMPPLLR